MWEPFDREAFLREPNPKIRRLGARAARGMARAGPEAGPLTDICRAAGVIGFAADVGFCWFGAGHAARTPPVSRGRARPLLPARTGQAAASAVSSCSANT